MSKRMPTKKKRKQPGPEAKRLATKLSADEVLKRLFEKKPEAKDVPASR